MFNLSRCTYLNFSSWNPWPLSTKLISKNKRRQLLLRWGMYTSKERRTYFLNSLQCMFLLLFVWINVVRDNTNTGDSTSSKKTKRTIRDTYRVNHDAKGGMELTDANLGNKNNIKSKKKRKLLFLPSIHSSSSPHARWKRILASSAECFHDDQELREDKMRPVGPITLPR